MRSSLFFLVFSFCFCTFSISADPVIDVELWSGTAPGEKEGAFEAESAVPGGETPPIIRVSNVSVPSLAVYQPASEKATGTCVIIFPGGGYNILAYNHEGTEIAEWLNSCGVTAVVVKYRVPRRPDQEKHLAPLQDAQRAIRLVRQNAETWNIDPNRIGVLGFSAGAHLTLLAATNYDEKVYEPMDDIDKISAKPNFAVPIYLAYARGERADALKTDIPLEENIKITPQTPPMFLSVANDDSVGAMGSVMVYIKMVESRVPCELHVFVKGGHGYGMRHANGPAAEWNILCEKWMRQMDLLKK